MTYDPKENYCTCSPDSIYGVKINYNCYLHDRQYRNEVKKRKTRKQADLDLRNGIYRDLEHKSKFLAYFVSRVYYWTVRIFMGRFWVKNG